MNCDDEAYCSEGCGQPATTERTLGVVDPEIGKTLGLDDELLLMVELVCERHTQRNQHAYDKLKQVIEVLEDIVDLALEGKIEKHDVLTEIQLLIQKHKQGVGGD